MFKKIFILFLFFSIIIFKTYAVYVPTAKISKTHTSMYRIVHSLAIDENGKKVVVIEKCLKPEYLFLNYQENYCVIRDIVSYKVYFIEQYILPVLLFIYACLIIGMYNYNRKLLKRIKYEKF